METNQPYRNQEPVKLTKGSPEFESVYLAHFNALHRYACTFVGDDVVAEEMVHQMFWRLLEIRDGIKVHTSLKAYLYRSVYNECMNYLKHQKVKHAYQTHTMNLEKNQYEDAAAQLQYRELEKKVKHAINNLPEQCRTIFQLSRFENLKYREIAAQLDLSVKTVETQMSRALKKLRIQLADYLPIILWVLYNSF